jgi:hypothetical protein
MFRVVSAGCAARHDAPGLLLVGLRPTGVDEDAVRRVLKVSSGKRDEFGPAEGAGEAYDEECLSQSPAAERGFRRSMVQITLSVIGALRSGLAEARRMPARSAVVGLIAADTMKVRNGRRAALHRRYREALVRRVR